MKTRTPVELEALRLTKIANSDGGNPDEHEAAGDAWLRATEQAPTWRKLRAYRRMAVNHYWRADAWRHCLKKLARSIR